MGRKTRRRSCFPVKEVSFFANFVVFCPVFFHVFSDHLQFFEIILKNLKKSLVRSKKKRYNKLVSFRMANYPSRQTIAKNEDVHYGKL